MSNIDRRTKLLRVGVETFTERGFFNTSVNEIVSAADVPKGSFSYYFGHKDKYMLDVIHSYAKYFNKKLDRILLDRQYSPIDRIQNFINEATYGMKKFHFKRGCLVGNLGQELGALDDDCRQLLLETLKTWQDRIFNCLQEAKDGGIIPEDTDIESISRFFWYAWEGAVLCSKLEKSTAPLDIVGKEFMNKLRALAKQGS